MLCWTKYKGYVYDEDYRDPKLWSIKSDASYDPTPIDYAICTYVQIKVSWFKHSIVLNGLRCGIVHLFDSFVPRRSIIYFIEWGQTPMYSHVAVVAGVKKYSPQDWVSRRPWNSV